MSSSVTHPAGRPEIQLESGRLVGRTSKEVNAFKGVPYAAPPVGPLRWKPPQPAGPWTEPRDAGAYGAVCIQPQRAGDPGVGSGPQSEDCLTLNVWAAVGQEQLLPVMVWVHGGGFYCGSGTADLYDGANLARRGVVVVTLNYRLGRLGFFDHPALAAERPAGEPAGNYGLMDIVAALAWVRANITAFGGDPDNVTVFGESAGGAAVTRLMISLKAQGLFHKAVVQSGLGRERAIPLDRSDRDGRPSAQARGQAWADAAGLGPDPSAAQLRALDAEAMLTPLPSFYDGDLLLLDGQVVIDQVAEAFAAGRQARIPLLIGSNSREFGGLRPADLSPYDRIEAGLAESERAALVDAYGGQASYEARALDDLVFNEPARHLARLHSRTGQPTWLYRFDVSDPAAPGQGALHGAERAYVFDNLGTLPATASEIADRWVRFARSGDPNGPEQADWPKVSDQDTRLLEFTDDGPAARPVPFSERLDHTEAFYGRLG